MGDHGESLNSCRDFDTSTTTESFTLSTSMTILHPSEFDSNSRRGGCLSHVGREGRANLRILIISGIKTLPCVPLSHPFVERLIGTVRRECLDKTLFWNERDLERKLTDFKDYYNRYRSHDSLDGVTPLIRGELVERKTINLSHYCWRSHCRGLYQMLTAA
jgi:hypothetical protein